MYIYVNIYIYVKKRIKEESKEKDEVHSALNNFEPITTLSNRLIFVLTIDACAIKTESKRSYAYP